MIKGEGRFQWPDYVVFALSLLISAAIGIYYHFQSRKKSTTDEYLMGSRDMGILPVCVSLMVSVISAIAVLGVPAEAYAYGVRIAFFNVGFSISMCLACVFYMPVYHRLKLTSLYEYLEMRFDHRVRLMCSILAMVQMVLYSSVALYAPAIAISAVTGMPYWACILLSAVLCTFYTTLGGYKTVLWTDTVQAFIMFLGLVATLAKGLVDAGGWNRVFNMTTMGGRMELGSPVFNPLVRYNMWTWLVGDIPLGLAIYATGQFSVQRFCSVRSINKARIALFGVAPILASFSLMSMVCGFIAFAYYYGCDPLDSGKIQTRDQTLPVLVMDLFHSAPGMSGVFLSSVLSAALSTLSSVQNSFAAVLLEDGVKPLKKRLTGHPLSDRMGTFISKCIVFLLGATIMVLAMGVANLGKLLFQMSSTFTSIAAGPALGCFSMGLFMPFVNSTGAMVGTLTGMSFLAWIAFGALGLKKGDKPLPTYNHLCPEANGTVSTMLSLVMSNMTAADNGSSWNALYSLHSNASFWETQGPTPVDSLNSSTITSEQGDLDSNPFILYRISFRYYVLCGCIPTIIVGVLVSLLTGGWKQRHLVPDKLLFSWRQHGIRCQWQAEDEDDEVKGKELAMMDGESGTGHYSEKFLENDRNETLDNLLPKPKLGS